MVVSLSWEPFQQQPSHSCAEICLSRVCHNMLTCFTARMSSLSWPLELPPVRTWDMYLCDLLNHEIKRNKKKPLVLHPKYTKILPFKKYYKMQSLYLYASSRNTSPIFLPVPHSPAHTILAKAPLLYWKSWLLWNCEFCVNSLLKSLLPLLFDTSATSLLLVTLQEPQVTMFQFLTVDLLPCSLLSIQSWNAWGQGSVGTPLLTSFHSLSLMNGNML